MRAFLSIALALALVGPLFACINDTELINHEREFKSQYQESPGTDSLSPGAPASNLLIPFAATGAGGVLLLGAACLVLRRPGASR